MTELSVSHRQTANSRRRQPGARLRLPTHWLGVAPFFMFALMFLILPTAYLVVGAFQNEGASSRWKTSSALSQPTIVAAYWISIRISLASALLGALIGLAIAIAIVRGGLPDWVRSATLTFSGVASNFAGVPLAFAFLATLGRLGLVTVLLRDLFGVNIYALRLQHPVLLGPDAHLSLFPDPADGGDHHAGHRRAEEGMGRGGRHAGRHAMRSIGAWWSSRCCGRASSAR